MSGLFSAEALGQCERISVFMLFLFSDSRDRTLRILYTFPRVRTKAWTSLMRKSTFQRLILINSTELQPHAVKLNAQCSGLVSEVPAAAEWRLRQTTLTENVLRTVWRCSLKVMNKHISRTCVVFRSILKMLAHNHYLFLECFFLKHFSCTYLKCCCSFQNVHRILKSNIS